MKLEELDYCLEFDRKTSTISIKGILRLPGLRDYEPIKSFLYSSSRRTDTALTLDLSELINLNSAGITTISTFALGLKRENRLEFEVIGNERYHWQRQMIPNLQKLWKDVKYKFVS
ncbi:MAG: hypothetical protein H7A25_04120 [Leptospiraceae bacterium]|nr:hypothetical protein [Leptospiraceae bacterium]